MRGIAAAVFLAAIGMIGLMRPAIAVGLCDCCTQELNQSCQTVCAGQTKVQGQCMAAVDYAGKGGTERGKNPLTGISLKDLSLGNPTAGQLESFRRFLEAGRRRAIAEYNRAARRLRYGRITESGFAAAKASYREAMVNYYHGIHAYLNKIGAKSD